MTTAVYAADRVEAGVERAVPLVVLVVREGADRVEPWLQAQLRESLALLSEEVVIDRTHCEPLDATLLHLLRAAHRQARQQDGRLTLRGLSPRLVRVIALSGLLDVFDIEARAV